MIYVGSVVICRKSPKNYKEVGPPCTYYVEKIDLNGSIIYLRGFICPFYVGNFEFVYQKDEVDF